MLFIPRIIVVVNWCTVDFRFAGSLCAGLNIDIEGSKVEGLRVKSGAARGSSEVWLVPLNTQFYHTHHALSVTVKSDLPWSCKICIAVLIIFQII